MSTALREILSFFLKYARKHHLFSVVVSSDKRVGSCSLMRERSGFLTGKKDCAIIEANFKSGGGK
jgi:hypothetical protein